MPRDYSQRPHGHKRVKQAGRDLSLRSSHLTSYTRPMRRAVLFRQLGEGRDTPLVVETDERDSVDEIFMGWGCVCPHPS